MIPSNDKNNINQSMNWQQVEIVAKDIGYLYNLSVIPRKGDYVSILKENGDALVEGYVNKVTWVLTDDSNDCTAIIELATSKQKSSPKSQPAVKKFLSKVRSAYRVGRINLRNYNAIMRHADKLEGNNLEEVIRSLEVQSDISDVTLEKIHDAIL